MIKAKGSQLALSTLKQLHRAASAAQHMNNLRHEMQEGGKSGDDMSISELLMAKHLRKQVLVEEGLAAHKVSTAAFRAKSKALAESRDRREAAQARRLRQLKEHNDYELQAVDDACIIDEKGDLMLPDMDEVHPDQAAALQLVDV